MSRIDSLRKANQSEEKSEKFNIDSRLVEELGASQLSGKDKREYERKWLQRVGANPEKRNNIPYHILKGMRKKQSIRETKKRNIDIQAGNKPGVSSDVKERTEDRDRGLRRKFGKYKEGVLQLSKDEVMSITGSR